MRLEHETLIDRSIHRAAAQWCEENLGKRWDLFENRTGRWSMFWAGREERSMYRFCFANEKDMMLFILRWL